MADKPTPRKKKSKPAAAPSRIRVPDRGATKVRVPKSTFYFSLDGSSLEMLDRKPRGGQVAGPFSTFAEARSAALDALIDSIENSERALDRLRGASSLESWRDAASA